jgi:glycosyltransferase involved in cell wall biosynthesis
MTISTVIPLYNKGPHIRRALESVRSQSAPPREIIVVDDGSTDGGGEVAQTWADPRLIYIRQENQGEGAARNRGTDAARGELIAFLDADDAWDPDFLATIMRLRKKFPEAGACATAYRVVFPGGLVRTPDFPVLPPGVEEGLIRHYVRHGLRFPVWSSAVAVPRKVLQEIGGFQADEPKGADVDAWLKIALRFPLAFSRRTQATYFQDAVNRTDGWRWDQEPAVSRTARQALAAGLVPPEEVQDLRTYAAHFQILAARDCLVLGKRDLARQLLEYARGVRRLARQWWFYRLVAALPEEAGPRLWRLKQILKRVRGRPEGSGWQPGE